MLLLLVLLTGYHTTAIQAQCQQEVNCILPSCSCPTFTHYKFPNKKDIPQMVYWGFDDAVTAQVDQFYKSLFASNRKNPNGCPITMSLYVQNEYTDYGLVKENFERGNEIGVHSVTHTMVDTREKLIFEAGKQKDNLTRVGQVPRDQIVGWRSPNLKPAGNAQPEVLRDLNYTYDITLTYTIFNKGGDIPYPFTLDFKYPYTCNVPECPTNSYNGFWIVPSVSLFNYQTGYPCPYVDSCRPADEEEAFDYLWQNFLVSYNGTRAPFGLNMHAAWFFTPAYLQATDRFIRRLLELGDVYIISVKQVLDWMRNPVKVSEVNKLPEWNWCKSGSTDGPPPTTTSTLFESSGLRETNPVTVTFQSTTKRPKPMRSTPSSTTLIPRSITTTTSAPTRTILTTSRPTSNPDSCSLPSCLRNSLSPPTGLNPRNTPQIIYITISSVVDGALFDTAIKFLNRKNPNGCPISATFFRPESGNNADYLQTLRSLGHEIAARTQERYQYNTDEPVRNQVADEIQRFQVGQNTGILGLRSPSVDLLGDTLLEVEVSANLQYDSSITFYRPPSYDHMTSWPFTLDEGLQGLCSSNACPSGRYPGLWEVPIIPFVDYKQSFVCEYVDSCYYRPTTENETFAFLNRNFQNSYYKNRAPLGINLRRDWFSHSFYVENYRGVVRFLDSLSSFSDVYLVSIENLVQWMQNPTGIDKIDTFSPWKC